MEELEAMKHYMAAEKVINLIYCIEMTMEFMKEFNIPADEEVKKALKPKLNETMKWLE